MPAIDLLTSTENESSARYEELTNIDEIQECLRLIDEEETRVDASLDAMLSQETQLDASLESFGLLREQLRQLMQSASQVTTRMDKTSQLAEVISHKVRQLDQEQLRVRQAIQYVEDVQELKYCVANLQEAIEKREYDEAALLLQRASKIDSTILNGSLAEFTVVCRKILTVLLLY
ncbi:hypothetical protein BD560DRAFT_335825 [Blakeslea trispora]|nr:hypothetical protein BD560DRAFT_335825 [Blakeslea trispora]